MAKQKKVYQFSDKDNQIIHLMKECGIDKSVATVIWYLHKRPGSISREIQEGTNLTQPQVSVAFSHLKNEGLLEIKNENREGRGRPVKIMSLKYKLKAILSTYSANIDNKISYLNSVKKQLESVA